MKELIKIITNEEGQQLVSARELHEFLESKRHFTDWMKTYISENNDYGFIENVDFTRIHAGVNPTNGIPIIDYAVTINMAKELSMLSKTEKGKQARKYFIKCEEKLKEELQNKELTEADRIVKLLNVIPESERGKYMLELVDRFYPIGNNIEVKTKYEPRNNNKLNYDLFKKVLNGCYDDAYIDNKVHKGVEYVVIDKKILEREFISIGIDKKVLNRFIRENKPCVKAQIRHGEENNDSLVKKEVLEEIMNWYKDNVIFDYKSLEEKFNNL